MKHKTNKQMLLELEIERLYKTLGNIDVGSDEYLTTMSRLNNLEAIYENNILATKISAKDVLSSATTLLGIGVIVGYESSHALTSKAINVVTKKL